MPNWPFGSSTRLSDWTRNDIAIGGVPVKSFSPGQLLFALVSALIVLALALYRIFFWIG